MLESGYESIYNTFNWWEYLSVAQIVPFLLAAGLSDKGQGRKVNKSVMHSLYRVRISQIWIRMYEENEVPISIDIDYRGLLNDIKTTLKPFKNMWRKLK